MDMRSRIVNLVTLSLLMGVLVGGCSSSRRGVSSRDRDLQALRSAESRLADAAASVSNSLTELAAIEKSAAGKTSKPGGLIDAEVAGMNQLVSIDWSGAVEPLVKKLSSVCKYKFKVLGKAPGIPVLVSITAKDRTVIDLLRDINFQSATKADIEIYPASKLIELRYK